MIKLQQVKFDLDHSKEDIIKRIQKELKLKDQDFEYVISKKSIDARHKNDIKIVYNLDIKVIDQNEVLKNIKNKNIILSKDKRYEFPKDRKVLDKRPVIVGFGPAGIFCALLLAENGYNPIVLERGKDVDRRINDVTTFWTKSELNTESNVQFGEGGAGTFSDGKLNTMVKDKYKRNRKVLETFVEAGAPDDILYINKPHIGTDYLRTVVKNIRKKIIDLGGEVRFESKVTSILIENDQVVGVEVNKRETIETDSVVLALGHSARDTFEMLRELKVNMERKAFAIGVRIEHPQKLISQSQYGKSYQHKELPVADYKLTHRSKNGRGVYSFCMCPGGMVVNASSEGNKVVTNGMSNYKRDEMNANSAILVNVTPEDFIGEDVLSGVTFQRKWEKLAFELGGSSYNIPIQLFGDFLKDRASYSLGDVGTSLGDKVNLANLNDCLPKYVCDSLKEGILEFDKKIKGFSQFDSVLSGVETRSSSPIRILRDENLESDVKGLYPCGEGAGYAGGIMSASMDGIKVAEALVKI